MPNAKLKRSFARDRCMPIWMDFMSVKEQTYGALLCEVTLAIGVTDSCWNCGLKLSDPVSQMICYGPDCCAHLGIDRGVMTAEEAQKSLISAKDVWGVRTEWIPKGVIVKNLQEVLAMAPAIRSYGATLIPGVPAPSQSAPPAKEIPDLGQYSAQWRSEGVRLADVILRARQDLGRDLKQGELSSINKGYFSGKGKAFR
jgi:hypothetical protein